VTFQSWLFFCATATVLCFTPGPAVLLVVSQSLTRGARAGLGASLGILAINAFYYCLAATGIAAFVLASWDLFFLIKWLGAAYLVWLGLRMLLGQTTVAGAPPPGSLAPFSHGLVTQGSNPKAFVFFTALLPQFIDPAAGVPAQVAILGVSELIIELGVLALYVAVCQRARAMVQRPTFATSLNRAGGALLLGAGARLAVMRRS
jgi:homoserine/homoserine lactone efflux protein